MSVDITPLQNEIESSYAVDRVRQMADSFVERAKARCSRRTGTLAEGCDHDDPTVDGGTVRCRVFNDVEYAQYQDEGTGIFIGDNPITPTSAKALRFDWPAAGGVVFYKSVAGMPGTHFWSDTVAEFGEIIAGIS